MRRRSSTRPVGSGIAASIGLLLLLGHSMLASSDDDFHRMQLDSAFTCEGADAADIDGDGIIDVVAGAWWYKGPDFRKRYPVFSPRTYDPRGYSDQFSTFVFDIDGDGHNDVLRIGSPGSAALWYRNPGNDDVFDPTWGWEEHVACPEVSTESPILTDLRGNGHQVLVCGAGGRIGWYEPYAQAIDHPWRFHPLSAPGFGGTFVHGLGVGDIDGDGRNDVLCARGWWRQPEVLTGDPEWTFHAFDFGSGGAQMFVDDIDGDGLPDVVTSLDAHGYGLAWFQQVRQGGTISFIRHLILSDHPTAADPVVFSQLHALAFADIDGDGRKDIITGKRRWAHGEGMDADGNGKPVLYWFRRVGSGAAVHFEPHLIDDASGVGTRIVVRSLSGDAINDIIIGNKLGSFVFVNPRHSHQGGDRP
jgi:hypothetical protein